MSLETILGIKIFSPPSQNLVARLRLLSRLADALSLETCLMLLCAPAGFGSSQLPAIKTKNTNASHN